MILFIVSGSRVGMSNRSPRLLPGACPGPVKGAGLSAIKEF